MVSRELALDIIDEYLDEVRQYLPKDIADDIIAELRTHIIDKAEDMGGLTPENVRYILQGLGPPRKLASRYVVGTGRKILKIELGIPEDLYSIFVAILIFSAFMVMISVIAEVTQEVIKKHSVSPVWVIANIIGALISIVLVALALYLAFSYLGSNPNLKEDFKKMIREFTSKFTELFHTSLGTKKKPKKYVYKVRAWPELVNSIFLIIIAYVIYHYCMLPSFNWLMQLLIYTLIVYLGSEAILHYVHFLYIKFSGTRSYTIEFLGTILALVLLPWLFLANLYPELLQIPILNTEELETAKTFDDIIRNIKIVPLPPEHIILAKIVLMMILIALIVGITVTALRYVRTAPQKLNNRRSEQSLESKDSDN